MSISNVNHLTPQIYNHFAKQQKKQWFFFNLFSEIKVIYYKSRHLPPQASQLWIPARPLSYKSDAGTSCLGQRRANA
jgi:hypothetical protein